LDEVPTPDILVIVAEFLLKVHDISWSVISGIHERNLVVVVRNDGYRKDAGKAVKRAFGDIGCAGGHAAMARAEIPVERVVALLGKRSSTAVERYVRRALSPF
jgi:nanoRNase/pAp phosphatase (c-di-AMP/oligoRNAs hydrolase)